MNKDYFLMLGFFSFSILGLIDIVFTPVSSFYLELFFTELFILFAIILMFAFYNEARWVGRACFIFFLSFGLNLLYIKSLMGVNLLIGLLGLLCLIVLFLSLFSFGNKKEDTEEFINEMPVFEPDDTLLVEDIKPKSLGVFVASKNSSIFHLPDCVFAKRTKQEDKVWFNNKAQATRKKYKAHSCIK